MSLPLTLVVLITANDPNDSLVTSVRSAAREALGETTHVVLRRVAAVPPDDEALAFARGEDAGAVAEVVWSDAERTHATVRVHLGAATRWSVREIGFDASDVPVERGRTIGFAIASMMPEDDARAEAPPRALPTTQLVAPAALPDRATGTATTGASAAWSRFGVDASAVGVAALNGVGSSVGGSLAARWFASPTMALRLGGSFRGCDIDTAHAVAYFADLGAGFAWHPWRPLRAVSVGARADINASFQEMTRVADDHTKQRETRWLAGADFLFEGDWSPSSRVSLLLATGAAGTFGRTVVLLNDQEAAKLASLSFLTEAGVRLRF